MRPATASLVIGGSAWWPSSSRLASRSAAKIPRVAQVLGHVVGQDLERAFDPRARGDSGLRRAAQVGVVEVDEAVRRPRALRGARAAGPTRPRSFGPHLARASGGSLHRRDDDPVHPRPRGLRRNTQAARSADGAMAASFRGRSPRARPSDRVGERAGGEEGARQTAASSARDPVMSRLGSPRTGGGADRAGRSGGRGSPALDHPHGVVAAVPRARALHLHDLGPHAVELREIRATRRARTRCRARPRRRPGGDRVQTAREPQHRCEFRDPHRGHGIAEAVSSP